MEIYQLSENEKLDIVDMSIIGKYFESPLDFVNVVKANKKFQYLTTYYKFNPISDYELFERMQTQVIYKEADMTNLYPDAYKYVIQHNVLTYESGPYEHTFEKDMQLFITQPTRPWNIYLAIPKGFMNDDIIKELEGDYSVSPMACDNFQICCITTETFFSEINLDDDFFQLLNDKIRNSLNSDYLKEVYSSLNEIRRKAESKGHCKYRIPENVVFRNWNNVNDQTNDFIRISFKFDNGCESHEYLHERTGHSYIALNNIVLQEESFPKHMKNTLSNLDYFDVVYDTYENRVENVGNYTYHIDTLDAKRVLGDENCIIYCELTKFGIPGYIIFSKSEYGRDDLSVFDKGYGYFDTAPDDDILFKYTGFDDDYDIMEIERYNHACYYDFVLKKWCIDFCFNNEITRLISRLVILKFNEDRFKKSIGSNDPSIVNNFRRENGLLE